MYTFITEFAAQYFSKLLIILLLLNGFVWQPVYTANSPMLEIEVLDVGQGDSILVKSPDGRYGLIDGGKGNAVLAPLRFRDLHAS